MRWYSALPHEKPKSNTIDQCVSRTNPSHTRTRIRCSTVPRPSRIASIFLDAKLLVAPATALADALEVRADRLRIASLRGVCQLGGLFDQCLSRSHKAFRIAP